MARKYEVPIYATTGTLEEIQKMGNLGKIDPALFREVKEDVKLTIKDLTVNPMKISHDAAQPVGYRIAYGDKKVGICTDLGVYNDYTVECLKGMDALLLEANHDVKMLQVGPYPYYLKQRILGDRGHLSNENSGKLLCRILHDKLQAIVLGHLSKENNLPELAYDGPDGNHHGREPLPGGRLPDDGGRQEQCISGDQYCVADAQRISQHYSLEPHHSTLLRHFMTSFAP